MDFFETQAGYNFTTYTVPALVKAVNRLADQLEKSNKPLESVLARTNEMGVMFDGLMEFARTKNLQNPVFFKQLKTLWTAYCYYKDYEPDTMAYDRDIRKLWDALSTNEYNPFEDFDNFDMYMCEDLV